jgi:hypothetical protein
VRKKIVINEPYVFILTTVYQLFSESISSGMCQTNKCTLTNFGIVFLCPASLKKSKLKAVAGTGVGDARNSDFN